MKKTSTQLEMETTFSPTWFLKALGNGGLAVSFFMYLMFFIEHKNPLPTFSDLSRELASHDLRAVMVALVSGVILYFSYMYFYQLAVQLKRYFAYLKTDSYRNMLGTNDEITLMTLPLTLAMGINVIFVLGAVFVPHLWDYIEILFPFAILAFLAVGIYALKLFLNFFSDTLAKGNFDFVRNNNLGQMIAPFAFIMVSVGLAASVAMSHTKATNIFAFVTSVFFLVLAILLMNIKMLLGFKSIFKHGAHDEMTPTLWIAIPITTLIGITLIRLISGTYHHFLESSPNPIFLFIVLLTLFSIEVIFGLLGYTVMKRNNYFKKFVNGDQFHIGSYALICPGVAFVVLGLFFVNYGFIKTGFISKFSLTHWLLILPFVIVQLKTIQTLNRLNQKSKVLSFIQQKFD
ncbi:hypothetical protein [Fusibacter sp. 3D3]|uniref:TsoY family (seleno)protein n=1 Tax=Fusibacter sp. 3D3 TaxID=1048380 RepID=UPI000853D04B|nr:hypothetical protein [Fusibacter sp. 3D3]GAU75979.1 hypothetical protein F3D3_0575 [Fusibacter sp. 3D3]